MYFTVHTCFTYTRMYFYARVSKICTYLSGLLLSTLDSTKTLQLIVSEYQTFSQAVYSVHSVQQTCWAVYISDLFTGCLLFTLYSIPAGLSTYQTFSQAVYSLHCTVDLLYDAVYMYFYSVECIVDPVGVRTLILFYPAVCTLILFYPADICRVYCRPCWCVYSNIVLSC